MQIYQSKIWSWFHDIEFCPYLNSGEMSLSSLPLVISGAVFKWSASYQSQPQQDLLTELNTNLITGLSHTCCWAEAGLEYWRINQPREREFQTSVKKKIVYLSTKQQYTFDIMLIKINGTIIQTRYSLFSHFLFSVLTMDMWNVLL